ncbi:hypothetical protein GCM10009642_32580 [Nocardiopsis metallicus]
MATTATVVLGRRPKGGEGALLVAVGFTRALLKVSGHSLTLDSTPLSGQAPEPAEEPGSGQQGANAPEETDKAPGKLFLLRLAGRRR